MSTKTDIIIGTFIILVVATLMYLYTISNKIDKIYSEISIKSCDSLPYGIQDKIEQSYDILSSSTCKITQ